MPPGHDVLGGIFGLVLLEISSERGCACGPAHRLGGTMLTRLPFCVRVLCVCVRRVCVWYVARPLFSFGFETDGRGRAVAQPSPRRASMVRAARDIATGAPLIGLSLGAGNKVCVWVCVYLFES
jgi:hypothetical protein